MASVGRIFHGSPWALSGSSFRAFESRLNEHRRLVDFISCHESKILFFRPFGALELNLWDGTHSLRCGLRSFAASRLELVLSCIVTAWALFLVYPRRSSASIWGSILPPEMIATFNFVFGN